MPDSIYCYPGTDVLINKLDIHDPDILHDAERDLTARRLLQLQQDPIKGKFDYNHLKRIHKFLFQDLYLWAGKERTVDIAKSDMFCRAAFLSDQASEIFSKLKRESLLANLSKDEFIQRVVYYFGEINALHPFREGNGRTQREFFRELAIHADHEINYSSIGEEEMVEASRDSFVRKYDRLNHLMSKAVIR